MFVFYFTGTHDTDRGGHDCRQTGCERGECVRKGSDFVCSQGRTYIHFSAELTQICFFFYIIPNQIYYPKYTKYIYFFIN